MENSKNFIEIEKGTIPLIFSVPHGGTFEPHNVPKRSSGIMGVDKKTIGLTRELVSYIEIMSEKKNAFIQKPSCIISKIRRCKIDLNRDETEAFHADSKLGKKVYWNFHKDLEKLISENIKMFNYSLLIDIHGFEKHKRPEGFRDVELVLGTNNLTSLFPVPIPIKDWDKNIRGKIIRKFIDLGIPIAPSHPRRKEYILTGGFIIQKYGASNIPVSQTMQIEFSDIIRVYDEKLKKKVLKALSEVLLNHIL